VAERNGQSEPGLGGWGQKGQWAPLALKRAPTPGKIKKYTGVCRHGHERKGVFSGIRRPCVNRKYFKANFELAIEKIMFMPIFTTHNLNYRLCILRLAYTSRPL
jgi:hypothetical protein